LYTCFNIFKSSMCYIFQKTTYIYIYIYKVFLEEGIFNGKENNFSVYIYIYIYIYIYKYIVFCVILIKVCDHLEG
jgi:hypothetical protein